MKKEMKHKGMPSMSPADMKIAMRIEKAEARMEGKKGKKGCK